MIASVIMYQMVCDKCEETLKYNGNQEAFEFQYEALQCAKESDLIKAVGENKWKDITETFGCNFDKYGN